MRLNDPLITDIEFEGVTYPLDLAFDNVLDVFDVIKDKELLPFEKVEIILDLMVGDQELLEKLSLEEKLELWSEIYTKHIDISETEFVEYDLLGEPLPTEESDKCIDLEKDAKFIYASFFCLGINLFEQQGKLSWMEFQAILQALPENSIMSKIIQIRQYEPSKGESTEYKLQMEKLKRKYSLKKVGEEDG